MTLQILEIHDYFTLAEVLAPLILSLLFVALNIPQKLSQFLGAWSPEAFLVAFHICFVFIAVAIDCKFGNFGKTTAFYGYSEYENVVHRSNFSNMLIYYVLVSSLVSGIVCGLANQRTVRWFFTGVIVGMPSILYIYLAHRNAKNT